MRSKWPSPTRVRSEGAAKHRGEQEIESNRRRYSPSLRGLLKSVARRSHRGAIAATDRTPARPLIQLRLAFQRTKKYLRAHRSERCIPTKVSMSPTPSRRAADIFQECFMRECYASSRNQSRGRRKSEYKRASGVPGSGCQLYSHRTSGGSDIRMDSVRPPDCRPNEVPRSYTKLNST
jgi:hypothetical protein